MSSTSISSKQRAAEDSKPATKASTNDEEVAADQKRKKPRTIPGEDARESSAPVGSAAAVPEVESMAAPDGDDNRCLLNCLSLQVPIDHNGVCSVPNVSLDAVRVLYFMFIFMSWAQGGCWQTVYEPRYQSYPNAQPFWAALISLFLNSAYLNFGCSQLEKLSLCLLREENQAFT